jgi:hypothetical protein
VTVDTGLFLAGLGAEAIFAGLLIHRRVFRVLPLFSSYIFWSLVNDAGGFYLLQRFPAYAVDIYFAATILDSVFVFLVLVELSMSVLRPVRSMLPRKTIPAVAIFIVLMCAAIWPLTTSPGIEHLHMQSRMIVHLKMTFSAVRILFFLALAVCSQWLSIGWRDRELQVATGMGFFSLASLCETFYRLNHGVGTQEYHLVELMLSASYACSIVYWIVSFAHEVPERREFTPQMQNFLLAVAGSARSTRLAMTDSPEAKAQSRAKR